MNLCCLRFRLSAPSLSWRIIPSRGKQSLAAREWRSRALSRIKDAKRPAEPANLLFTLKEHANDLRLVEAAIPRVFFKPRLGIRVQVCRDLCARFRRAERLHYVSEIWSRNDSELLTTVARHAITYRR